MPVPPATTNTRPTAFLCVSLRRTGTFARAHAGVATHAPASDGSRGGKPISTATRRPTRALAGWRSDPSLGAPNATVTSARTASPSTAPVVAIDPGRHVDRNHRSPGRVHRADGRGLTSPGRAADTGPEDPVDHDGGPLQTRAPAALVEIRVLHGRYGPTVQERVGPQSIRGQYGARLATPGRQDPECDQRVSTVVPGADHAHDGSFGPQAVDDGRRGTAGVLHQYPLGHTGLTDRTPIPAPPPLHRSGRERTRARRAGREGGRRSSSHVASPRGSPASDAGGPGGVLLVALADRRGRA